MKKNLFRIIAANAMDYMKYTRSTDDPTFTVLGSLQANKYSKAYAFHSIYATLRFDPTGNGTPTYTLLDMQLIVTGSGCTLMMFGSIVVSGVRMLGDCGYSSRNMSISALSLSIGLGFTQTPQIFRIFPDLFKSVFADNCVAVVFIVAVVLNLVYPKEHDEDIKIVE